MLRGLYIRNMLLIDRLELDFQPGLNVLTGETGTGKSILLDSLGFVLGWRGQGGLVRDGAEQGEVAASFEVNQTHVVHGLLADFGLPPAKDELLLRRTCTKAGRKTAYVNDRRCAGDTLRALADCLVELHGQHDDRGLLNARGHRALLDTFAGVDVAATQDAWRKLCIAQAGLQDARAALEAVEKDAGYLRHAADELNKLNPQTGEDAELAAKRRLMQGAERIRTDIERAAQALGADAAETALIDATRWLEAAADPAEGRLDTAIAALGRALSELAEAQRGVEECLHALDFDPLELEAAEERLFAIRGLARKHGVLPDELPAVAHGLQNQLAAIDTGKEHIAALQSSLTAAQAAYQDAATKSTARRKKAARQLDQAMVAELAPLKMERAVFTTKIAPCDPGPDGRDQVEFQVSTNPGARAGPINRIASGGELSRFLLALKVCLTARNFGVTLIFDEIDRGLGGATADAVGRRLAVLATNAQILVVTHSPQVAAQASHQWQVTKSVKRGVTRSQVSKLDAGARTAEIARMLAGDVITAEATAAARALLAR